eukprot:TRINITY_DN7017_c0_g1_i2.p1 TRINITY_DN7017_c0_g1~~TRINITY_DN7017_c0_g1_i2.p1  ORF type:complete len:1778 (-),score=418.45 TRINITY_DN7017_c0_g1_i2:221-5554(-)
MCNSDLQSEIDLLKRDFNSQVSSLKQNIADLQEANNKMIQVNKEYEDQMTDLEDELKSLKDQLSSVDNSKKDVQVLSERMTRLTDDYTSQKHLSEKLQAELDAAKSNASEDHQHQKSLEHSLQQEKESNSANIVALAKLQETLESLKSELALKDSKVVALNHEMTKKDDRLAEFETHVHQLEEMNLANTRKEQELVESVQSLRAENDRLRQSVSSAEQDDSAVQNYIKDLQNQLQQLNEELLQTKQALFESESLASQRKESCSQLEAQVAEQSIRISEADALHNSQLNDAQAANSVLEEKLNQLLISSMQRESEIEAQHNQLEEEIANLKKAILSKENDCETHKKDIGKLYHEIESLMKGFEQSRFESEQQKQQISNLQAMIEGSSNDSNQNAQLQEFEEKLLELQAKERVFEDEARECKESVDSLLLTNASLKAECEELKNLTDDTNAQLSILEEEIQTKAMQVKELTNECNQKAQALEKSQGQLNILQRENQTINQELNSLKRSQTKIQESQQDLESEVSHLREKVKIADQLINYITMFSGFDNTTKLQRLTINLDIRTKEGLQYKKGTIEASEVLYAFINRLQDSLREQDIRILQEQELGSAFSEIIPAYAEYCKKTFEGISELSRDLGEGHTPMEWGGDIASADELKHFEVAALGGLQLLEQAISTMQSHLKDTTEEKQLIETRLSNVQQELKSMYQKNRELSSSNEQLRNSLSEQREQEQVAVHEMKNEIASLMQSLQTYSESIRRQNVMIDQLTTQNIECKQELDNTPKVSHRSIVLLQATILGFADILGTEVPQDLQGVSLRYHDDENIASWSSSWEHICPALTRELQDRQRDSKSDREKLTHAYASIDSLKKDCLLLEKALAQSQQGQQDAESRLQSLQIEHDMKEQDIQRIRQEADDRARFITSRAEVDQFESHRKSIGHMEGLKHKIEKLNGDIEELNRRELAQQAALQEIQSISMIAATILREIFVILQLETTKSQDLEDILVGQLNTLRSKLQDIYLSKQTPLQPAISGHSFVGNSRQTHNDEQHTPRSRAFSMSGRPILPHNSASLSNADGNEQMVEHLRASIREKDQMLGDLKRVVHDSELQLGELTSERQSLIATIENLQSRNAQLEDQLYVQRSLSGQVERNLGSLVTSTHADYQTLNEMLNREKMLRADAEAKATHANGEVLRLLADLDGLKSRLSEQISTVSMYSDMLDELGDLIDQTHRLVQDETSDIRPESRVEIKIAHEEILVDKKTKWARVHELVMRFQELLSDFRAIESVALEVDLLFQKLLEMGLVSRHVIIRSSNHQVQVIASTIEGLWKEKQDLQAKISFLQSECARMDEAHRATGVELRQLQKERESASVAHNQLCEQLKAESAHRQDLLASNENLKIQIANIATALRLDESKHMDQIRELKDIIRKQQDEIRYLQAAETRAQESRPKTREITPQAGEYSHQFLSNIAQPSKLPSTSPVDYMDSKTTPRSHKFVKEERIYFGIDEEPTLNQSQSNSSISVPAEQHTTSKTLTVIGEYSRKVDYAPSGINVDTANFESFSQGTVIRNTDNQRGFLQYPSPIIPLNANYQASEPVISSSKHVDAHHVAENDIFQSSNVFVNSVPHHPSSISLGAVFPHDLSSVDIVNASYASTYSASSAPTTARLASAPDHRPGSHIDTNTPQLTPRSYQSNNSIIGPSSNMQQPLTTLGVGSVTLGAQPTSQYGSWNSGGSVPMSHAYPLVSPRNFTAPSIASVQDSNFGPPLSDHSATSANQASSVLFTRDLRRKYPGRR